MKSTADTAAMYKNAAAILKASLPCALPFTSYPATVRALPSAIRHQSVHSVSITTSLTLVTEEREEENEETKKSGLKR